MPGNGTRYRLCRAGVMTYRTRKTRYGTKEYERGMQGGLGIKIRRNVIGTRGYMQHGVEHAEFNILSMDVKC